MSRESKQHLYLKQETGKYIKELGYNLFFEYKVRNERIDVVGLNPYNSKDVILCECVCSQSISKAKSKLIMIKGINNFDHCRLIIVRRKSLLHIRKVKERLAEDNIKLLEFEVPQEITMERFIKENQKNT